MQSTRRDLKNLTAHILKGTEPSEAVVVAWPLACGSAVAARTEAVDFVNGTLRVRVPDSGWKAQLEDFSQTYLQKLSELSGSRINRIFYEVARPSAAMKI